MRGLPPWTAYASSGSAQSAAWGESGAPGREREGGPVGVGLRPVARGRGDGRKPGVAGRPHAGPVAPARAPDEPPLPVVLAGEQGEDGHAERDEVEAELAGAHVRHG